MDRDPRVIPHDALDHMREPHVQRLVRAAAVVEPLGYARVTVHDAVCGVIPRRGGVGRGERADPGVGDVRRVKALDVGSDHAARIVVRGITEALGEELRDAHVGRVRTACGGAHRREHFADRATKIVAGDELVAVPRHVAFLRVAHAERSRFRDRPQLGRIPVDELRA